MKFKNLLLVVAVAMVFAVTFTACSQSSNKVSVEDTEMVAEDGDEAKKCCDKEGDEAKKCCDKEGGEAKCGEGKCSEGKEASDSTKKCAEKKCGEGEAEGDEEKKCGDGE